jgi:hypothetical protein
MSLSDASQRVCRDSATCELRLAAAGGVGIAAIQLAKAAGAVVHGTASPGEHSQLVDLLGGTSLRRPFDLLRPGGGLVAYGLSSLQ